MSRSKRHRESLRDRLSRLNEEGGRPVRLGRGHFTVPLRIIELNNDVACGNAGPAVCRESTLSH
jgi:hypothetical protein